MSCDQRRIRSASGRSRSRPGGQASLPAERRPGTLTEQDRTHCTTANAPLRLLIGLRGFNQIRRRQGEEQTKAARSRHRATVTLKSCVCRDTSGAGCSSPPRDGLCGATRQPTCCRIIFAVHCGSPHASRHISLAEVQSDAAAHAERCGRPQLKLAFSYSLASEYDKTTFPVASSGNKKCCKLFFGSELVQNMTKLQKNVHDQSLEQLHKYQLFFQ